MRISENEDEKTALSGTCSANGTTGPNKHYGGIPQIHKHFSVKLHLRDGRTDRRREYNSRRPSVRPSVRLLDGA